MTADDVRFIQNVRQQFRFLSIERLYWLAVSLGEQLEERGCDAAPEARALVAALLADAHTSQRVIRSADCSDDVIPAGERYRCAPCGTDHVAGPAE